MFEGTTEKTKQYSKVWYRGRGGSSQ